MTTLKRRKLGLTHSTSESAGGYTLYAPLTGNGYVPLIDAGGDVVHEWNMPVRPGRHAEILESGNLAYNGSHAKSMDLYPAWDIWHGGHFMEANQKGDIVWEYEDPYHHHDAQWLDGGLLYTAAAEYKDKISDIVKMVDRNGDVVWEWRAWEYLTEEEWPVHAGFPDDHWPMINGLNLSGDTIYMSLRNTSGIIGVSRTTKEIVFKLKWPDVAQQHCPVITRQNTLLAFCNGNVRPITSVHHSRIVEYDLTTKELVWSYVDDVPESFFSPHKGSVQRLWNGNTFICESAFGRLFEVTTEGETVWEYVIPDFAENPSPLNEFITGEYNSCFKAYRYKTWQQQ